MIEEKLLACCRKLRLGKNLAENAMSAQAETHPEYLLHLLEAEVRYREKQCSDRLIKEAGFYSIKTFDKFIADDITFPSGVGIDDILTFDFVKEKRNLVMYGLNGTGKTFMSTAIGVAACKAGIPVRFFRTAALVNRLAEAKTAGGLTAFMDKILKAEIIVLDEWGYVPYDQTGSRLLFEVITESYERRSLILNTNIDFSRWVTVLGDENLTAATLERLLHNCHLFLFPGKSIRLRESSINNMYKDLSEYAESVPHTVRRSV